MGSGVQGGGASLRVSVSLATGQGEEEYYDWLGATEQETKSNYLFASTHTHYQSWECPIKGSTLG